MVFFVVLKANIVYFKDMLVTSLFLKWNIGKQLTFVIIGWTVVMKWYHQFSQSNSLNVIAKRDNINTLLWKSNYLDHRSSSKIPSNKSFEKGDFQPRIHCSLGARLVGLHDSDIYCARATTCSHMFCITCKEYSVFKARFPESIKPTLLCRCWDREQTKVMSSWLSVHICQTLASVCKFK